MLQATIVDRELFDPFPFLQNLSKVDVCRREVIQALVQTLMIVVSDSAHDDHRKIEDEQGAPLKAILRRAGTELRSYDRRASRLAPVRYTITV
jgi:hypothetical protein